MNKWIGSTKSSLLSQSIMTEFVFFSIESDQTTGLLNSFGSSLLAYKRLFSSCLFWFCIQKTLFTFEKSFLAAIKFWKFKWCGIKWRIFHLHTKSSKMDGIGTFVWYMNGHYQCADKCQCEAFRVLPLIVGMQVTYMKFPSISSTRWECFPTGIWYSCVRYFEFQNCYYGSAIQSWKIPFELIQLVGRSVTKSIGNIHFFKKKMKYSFICIPLQTTCVCVFSHTWTYVRMCWFG